MIPVKDPTSDMAQIAKKGSPLVRDKRQQNEQMKAQGKYWEVAGTNLGNVLGIKKSAEEDEGYFHFSFFEI